MLKKNLIGFLSALLIIPIDITNGYWQDFSLPAVILFTPVSILALLRRNSRESILMLFAILLSCFALILITPYSPNTSLRPLGSLIFFFSPITFYFLARKTITNNIEFLFFLKTCLYASALLAFSLYISVFILGDGLVRDMGVLNGNFFSLPLAGAYGVHSLTAHYFIIGVIISYYSLSGNANKFEIFLTSFVLMILMYFMALSLSREILLAIVFTFTAFIFKYFSYKKAFLAIVIAVFLGYLGIFYMLDDNSAWAVKIAQTLAADNLNDLSSGRLELQELAITQLARFPLTGTGFQGFELDFKSSESYDNLSGWSPHVYYLTAVWKMGIIAAIFYFTFFALIIKESLNFSKKYYTESSKMYSVAIFGFLVFINLLWDALLAASVMSLFSFFVGSMCLRRKTAQA